MTDHTNAALVYRCPDCINDTQLTEVTPGVWILNVLHDPTCPALNQLKTNDTRF